MYEVVEPRVEAIKKEIERILNLVELEHQGRPLKIDSFRLRNLAHWQTSYAENAFEALGPLSGVCNANCVFCMERTIPFERDHSFLSLQEAETRLRYFSPETKSCLFPPARPHMETLLNKDAVSILQKARIQSPSELFIITTNGTTLTPELVNELTQIKPLLIKLSLNSTDPDLRKSLMGISSRLNIAVESMGLLKVAGIPFVGSIVVWPDVDSADLEKNIRAICAYDPYGIRIRLPLVHKYMPAISEETMHNLWRDTNSLVNSIKGQLAVPVWVEPVQLGRVPLLPIIDGVILNSPAKIAGIQAGDRIAEINGTFPLTRVEVRSLFAAGGLDQLDSLEVKIQRGEELLTFSLNRITPASPQYGGQAISSYPYDPTLGHPGERFGMLFLPDFDLNYMDNILHLILKHQAEKVILFCSPLTAGTIEELITEVPVYQEFFQQRSLWIYTLEETWMGGNTQVMDSRFVSDYQNALKKICAENKDRPDLILIPDTFGSAWGIDFLGSSVFEIQNRTAIPVELLPWHFIYGRED